MTRCSMITRVTVAILTLFVGGAAVAESRQSRPAPARPTAPLAQAPVAPPQVQQWDAGKTREDLNAILDKCPPALGKILKLDPTILSNEAYLTAYPELAAFLAIHPEVARDPRYFLENVYLSNDYRMRPEDRAVDMWQGLLEGFAVFLAVAAIAGAVLWLVKAIIDYRRWNRLSKVHVEVHNKLLDRFSNTEELLAYVQSPAGSRFLETAPRPLANEGGDGGGPIRRILWAVQAGVVLATAGVGLLFVSDRVIAEIQQPLFAIGVIIVSLGVGFVVSAFVSYTLSVRMGLVSGRGKEA